MVLGRTGSVGWSICCSFDTRDQQQKILKKDNTSHGNNNNKDFVYWSRYTLGCAEITYFLHVVRG